MRRILNIILGLIYFLLFQPGSMLCALPALAALILHFAAGLPIKWFWVTAALWLGIGLVRFLINVLLYGAAMWGGKELPAKQKNMNPYGRKFTKTPDGPKEIK